MKRIFLLLILVLDLSPISLIRAQGQLPNPTSSSQQMNVGRLLKEKFALYYTNLCTANPQNQIIRCGDNNIATLIRDEQVALVGFINEMLACSITNDRDQGTDFQSRNALFGRSYGPIAIIIFDERCPHSINSSYQRDFSQRGLLDNENTIPPRFIAYDVSQGLSPANFNDRENHYQGFFIIGVNHIKRLAWTLDNLKTSFNNATSRAQLRFTTNEDFLSGVNLSAQISPITNTARSLPPIEDLNLNDVNVDNSVGFVVGAVSKGASAGFAGIAEAAAVDFLKIICKRTIINLAENIRRTYNGTDEGHKRASRHILRQYANSLALWANSSNMTSNDVITASVLDNEFKKPILVFDMYTHGRVGGSIGTYSNLITQYRDLLRIFFRENLSGACNYYRDNYAGPQTPTELQQNYKIIRAMYVQSICCQLNILLGPPDGEY